MQVEIIYKKIEDKDNNTIYVKKDKMSMKEARQFVKEYNKEGIIWIKAKWFENWHNRYRTLWER